MTVAGVQRRAQGLLDSGELRLLRFGPQEAVAERSAYPSRSERREGWTARTFLVSWTPTGWACECTPRQPSACPHVLALRGLIACQDDDHQALTTDPWECADAPDRGIPNR